MMEEIVVTEDDLRPLEKRFGSAVRLMGSWNSDGTFFYASVPLSAVRSAAKDLVNPDVIATLFRCNHMPERTTAFLELLNTFGSPLIAAIVAAYREWMRERSRGFNTGERSGTKTVATDSGRVVRSHAFSLRHPERLERARGSGKTRTLRRQAPLSCSVRAGASALAPSGGENPRHQRPPNRTKALVAHLEGRGCPATRDLPPDVGMPVSAPSRCGSRPRRASGVESFGRVHGKRSVHPVWFPTCNSNIGEVIGDVTDYDGRRTNEHNHYGGWHAVRRGHRAGPNLLYSGACER